MGFKSWRRIQIRDITSSFLIKNQRILNKYKGMVIVDGGVRSGINIII